MQAQGYKRDKGGDGGHGAKREKEQDEKMSEIVKGHGNQEIRLKHLLSDDLKNTHISWMPNPRGRGGVCVIACRCFHAFEATTLHRINKH